MSDWLDLKLKKLPTQDDIDRLERENAELKAQVELLCGMAYRKDAIMLMKYGLDGAACKRIYAMLNDLAPTQCLAEIKAQAVDECLEIAHSKFSCTGITSALTDYANQLRQQAKAGE